MNAIVSISSISQRFQNQMKYLPNTLLDHDLVICFQRRYFANKPRQSIGVDVRCSARARCQIGQITISRLKRSRSLLGMMALMSLAACSDREKGSELENAKIHSPDIKSLCRDEGDRTLDCEIDEGYWTDERRRKAKPLPFPKAEPPFEDLSLPDEQKPGAPVISNDKKPLEPAHPVQSTLCNDEARANTEHEACNQRVDDYWTDERRRKARPLEPTAPLPDGLSTNSELARPARKPTTEGGLAPLVSVPKLLDQK